MALETASLERLAHTLFATYCALCDVIQDLQRPSTAPYFTGPGRCLDLSNDDWIIPQCDIKEYYEREQCQRYNLLDQRYGKLLMQEAALRRAYLAPRNSDQHDLLLSQLDAVQHEMMELLNQLGDDNGEEE
jgi:hypothetical protein